MTDLTREGLVEGVELVGYFRFNEAWDMWEQIADEYKDAEPDIVPLYRRARAMEAGRG